MFRIALAAAVMVLASTFASAQPEDIDDRFKMQTTVETKLPPGFKLPVEVNPPKLLPRHSGTDLAGSDPAGSEERK